MRKKLKLAGRQEESRMNLSLLLLLNPQITLCQQPPSLSECIRRVSIRGVWKGERKADFQPSPLCRHSQTTFHAFTGACSITRLAVSEQSSALASIKRASRLGLFPSKVMVQYDSDDAANRQRAVAQPGQTTFGFYRTTGAIGLLWTGHNSFTPFR